jgi:hypothetical protein
MISFLIAIKSAPHIDLETLELQVASCLRVKEAQVLVGLSDDAHGHIAAWRERPVLINPRVQLAVTHDHGLCDAWNTLLAQANTRWVSFLGFGDLVLTPNYFERGAADPGGKNAHFSRVVIFGGKRSRLFGRPFRPWRHRIKQEVAHAGAIFERVLFLDEPYNTNFAVVGDYEWLLRCAARLNATFDPIVSVAMPAGGMSESMTARTKVELKRVKKLHAST